MRGKREEKVLGLWVIEDVVEGPEGGDDHIHVGRPEDTQLYKTTFRE